jgi:hypothetical protein
LQTLSVLDFFGNNLKGAGFILIYARFCPSSEALIDVTDDWRLARCETQRSGVFMLDNFGDIVRNNEMISSMQDLL